MLRKIAIAALMLPAAAWAHSVEDCPILPADSGLEWHWQPGPDFFLCYAIERATKSDAFGIYFGNHPGFDAERGINVTTGIVAGRDVVWYRGRGASTEGLSLQTLLTLGHDLDRSVAHVWVSGDSEPQLRHRLQILQRMQLRRD